MGLIGLLFSKYYKNYLVKGKKATIIVGEFKLTSKEPMFVFVSKGNSVEDSNELEKVGTANSIRVEKIEVKDLTNIHSSLLGYASVGEVKSALKKWHNLNSENAVISFVSFDFEPI